MFVIEVRANLDKSKVAEIIERKARQLAVSNEAISSVVVAADSDTDYGTCIRRSKGFTGGQTHSPGSGGKTIPVVISENRVACDLVFPRFVFEELVLGGDAASDHYKLFDYIVSHELAHAHDHSTRRVLQPKPLSDFGVPISALATYWGPLLLSEFAASFIAGATITAEQYELVARNAVECISAGMAALGTFKCQVYWNVLVEQAKIGGSSMGSSALSKPAFQRWARIGPEIVAQLEAFAGELRLLQASYPAWDEAIETAKFTTRCEALFDAMK